MEIRKISEGLWNQLLLLFFHKLPYAYFPFCEITLLSLYSILYKAKYPWSKAPCQRMVWLYVRCRSMTQTFLWTAGQHDSSNGVTSNHVMRSPACLDINPSSVSSRLHIRYHNLDQSSLSNSFLWMLNVHPLANMFSTYGELSIWSGFPRPLNVGYATVRHSHGLWNKGFNLGDAFSKYLSILYILCTISLAISYVLHLFVHIFVQYRTISIAITRTGS